MSRARGRTPASHELWQPKEFVSQTYKQRCASTRRVERSRAWQAQAAQLAARDNNNNNNNDDAGCQILLNISRSVARANHVRQAYCLSLPLHFNVNQ